MPVRCEGADVQASDKKSQLMGLETLPLTSVVQMHGRWMAMATSAFVGRGDTRIETDRTACYMVERCAQMGRVVYTSRYTAETSPRVHKSYNATASSVVGRTTGRQWSGGVEWCEEVVGRDNGSAS